METEPPPPPNTEEKVAATSSAPPSEPENEAAAPEAAPEASVASVAAAAPPAETAEEVRARKQTKRKKRRPAPEETEDPDGSNPPPKKKKPKQRRKDKDGEGRTKKRSKQRKLAGENGLSAAQQAVNEQMRRALEEDQYSANGSIVDTDTDDDEQHIYKGQSIRLDRSYLLQAARKHMWLERGGAASGQKDPGNLVDDANAGRKKKKKNKQREEGHASSSKGPNSGPGPGAASTITSVIGNSGPEPEFGERDESSIFGQTAGQSNSTWVECDKCKKWRRLRGVVDERKLPPKWYCSMNKSDPERARCSAPEEEYDTATTPESAADARTRKHLRIWVRRLQCNEAYEARQPTLTRGKKRAAASSSKEPYEWVRCCNPSCGKWRAILRIMDAKTHVIDRTNDGEWYCVMNTWDEKTASCAAPQENLPAVGCPPWVMQDEE